MSDQTITLIYDVVADAPACAIVQAGAGCGGRDTNWMLSEFDKWITAPNDNMRKITGTKYQWKMVAQRSNAVHREME